MPVSLCLSWILLCALGPMPVLGAAAPAVLCPCNETLSELRDQIARLKAELQMCSQRQPKPPGASASLPPIDEGPSEASEMLARAKQARLERERAIDAANPRMAMLRERARSQAAVAAADFVMPCY